MEQMKALLIASAIMVMCAPFVGCDEYDDDESLEGTTWQFSRTRNYEDGGFNTLTVTLQFNSGGKGVYTTKEIDEYNTWSSKINFTYVYDKPNITLYAEGLRTAYGTVSGNTMTLKEEDDDETTTVLTKQ
ncbi:MAG: hypothetical protein LBR13_05265 [Dysgonamonadaceae bacterium]|nr:hypothetical protein [Dysgonamonadaceae bacterium]